MMWLPIQAPDTTETMLFRAHLIELKRQLNSWLFALFPFLDARRSLLSCRDALSFFTVAMMSIGSKGNTIAGDGVPLKAFIINLKAVHQWLVRFFAAL